MLGTKGGKEEEVGAEEGNIFNSPFLVKQKL